MVNPTVRFAGLVWFGVALAHATSPVLPVTVSGVTATQAVLLYNAPDNTPCTVAVSQSSTMSPLMNDTNPVLFPGSNIDTRPGSIGNGTEHVVVIGKRSADVASDGRRYSRALQAFTQHYFSVTCSISSATGSFTTVNPPLGNNAVDTPVYDRTAWGNTSWPTINWLDQTVNYIDPLTGILLKRITGPGQGGSTNLDGSFYATKFLTVVDANNAWGGTATNILNSDGVNATYSGHGTTADYLFLAAPTGIAPGYPQQIVEDLLLRLLGSATGTTDDAKMQGCLSIDRGQTCLTNVIDFPLPSASAEIVGPGTLTGPSWFPAPLFGGWINGTTRPPASEQTATYNGTVNAAGTLATWVSGNYFNLDWCAGCYIKITGSGCSNGGMVDNCTIASVTDAKHVVLNQSSATVTGAAYTATNYGVKLWKKTVNGTVSIDSAKFDQAISTGYTYGGNDYKCGTTPVTTFVDRFGNALSNTNGLQGYLCTYQDQYGNNRLYFFAPSNGESRHLANYTGPFLPSPPADPRDAHGAGQVCNGAAAGSFDPLDPNSLYCVTVTGGAYNVLYKCTYSGNYSEFNDNYHNDNITCTNFTPASVGQDLSSALKAFAPTLDLTYFNNVKIGEQEGYNIALQINKQQNSLAYFAGYNLAQKQVYQVRDSWSTYPARWGGMHGGTSLYGGYGAMFLVPLNAQNSDGVGRYDLQINSISGITGTALPSNYAQDCGSLGVTDPRWIALGATGTNCVQMIVAGEPANTNPTPGDIAKFPYAPDYRGTHPTWAKLQNMAPGDGIADVSNQQFGEQFLVAKKTLNGDGTITIVLSRGAYPFNAITQTGCGAAPQAHASGWTPMLVLLSACSGNKSFDALTDANGSTSQIDEPAMNLAHSSYFIPDGLTLSQVQSGYQFRRNTLPGFIGMARQYPLNSYNPTFAGSTAGLNIGDIQSHPVFGQLRAPSSEQQWFLDGRPAGGALGGSSSVYNNLLTGPVAGTTNVYLVSNPASGYDPKRLPFSGWAGRFMLTEKSGPASVLGDADRDSFCVAYLAGECRPGSAAGSLYVNAHQVDTSGACLVNFNVNAPCLHTSLPFFGYYTQVGSQRYDASGSYWRRLSMWFNGPGRTDNFANISASSDGTWAFGACVYCDGIRTDLFAAKLPPWPGNDSVNRGAFVNIPVTLGASAVSANAQVRFGYAENGPVSSLLCTARQEVCTTGGSPFAFASETQTLQACSGGCTINLPALPGRVVYYVVDRTDNSGNIVSSTPMQAVAVP